MKTITTLYPYAKCVVKHFVFLLFSTAISAHAAFELYVSNFGDNTIRKFDAAGNMTVFATNGVNGVVDQPVGLVADNLGNIYVVNQNPDTIEKYDPSGHGSNFVNLGSTSFTYGGAALDSSNNLVVAIGANILKSVNASGTVTVLGGFAPYLNSPLGMTFDDAGNLYAVNTGNGIVEKFAYPATNATTFITNVPNPTTIAFDSAGNIYVTSGKFGAVNVMKFDANGNNGTVFVNGFNSGLTQPRGMAFDSAGNLYVANLSPAKILKFDPTGTTNGNGTVFADSTKGLSQPIFIVIREPGRYSDDWFKVAGGGGTSTGAGASVSGTIGQHDAGSRTGGTYGQVSGYWGVIAAVPTPGAPLLTITQTSPNSVTVSWPSPSTGFSLQQNSNLTTTNWVATAAPTDNGIIKFIIVTPPTGNLFYRLTQ